MKRNDKENEVSSRSLLSGLGKFINLMGEMLENDIDELNVKGVINNNTNNRVTGMYGISIRLGRGNAGNLQEDITRIISSSSSDRVLIEASSDEDMPEKQGSSSVEGEAAESGDRDF